jgi:hypothetical protein
MIPRMRAVAKALAMNQSEYIEWCIVRDEQALRRKPPSPAIAEARAATRNRWGH